MDQDVMLSMTLFAKLTSKRAEEKRSLRLAAHAAVWSQRALENMTLPLRA